MSSTSKGARPINPNRSRRTPWERANLAKPPPATPVGEEFAAARARRRLARAVRP